MNLDKFKSIATHQRALHVNDNKVIYSDSFGVQHIPKEIKKIYKKQKYHNKYLFHTSIQSDNVWILLYWIY